MKKLLLLLKKNLMLLLKAYIIGSSMTVPGVSGGTMAIILGVFDKLIYALNNIFKDFKNSFLFLLKFVIGACLGIGSLAFLITWLLETFTLPVSFFFVGAVIGGIPVIYKSMNGFNLTKIIAVLIGLGIVIGISFLPQDLLKLTENFSLQKFFICLITGIICAVALYLPGISTSHLLYVLGMYTATMNAIKTLDILFLLTLGLGTLIGFLLTTKPLAYALEYHEQISYSVILGFVIGSPLAIFTQSIIPEINTNLSSGTLWWIINITASLLLLIAGAAAIYALSKKEN